MNFFFFFQVVSQSIDNLMQPCQGVKIKINHTTVSIHWHIGAILTYLNNYYLEIKLSYKSQMCINV